MTDPRTGLPHGAAAQQSAAASAAFPARWFDAMILLLALAGTLGGVAGGPRLGDHEALVAQCARDMRLSGQWLVPHYLGDPYVRKPPLPYWLIAGLSFIMPADPATGLPVTTVTARLPSALAALGTVLLLWRLAASMLGVRGGRVTAVVASSCVFFLLYAVNATVEMILVFCCTWAHLHFWLALRHPVHSRRRRLHLALFYFAMGAGMMAKGPFPLAMVALPIAVWWYLVRPLRMIARDGPAAWRTASVRFLRDLWPRTVQAFRELWLLPGLVVFALCFVPWMIAVGLRHPDAWDLWNWQYWQRAQGDYEDSRPRGPLYYVPIVGGLIMPWLHLVFEAAAAPWLGRYARHRQALLYAGLWALIGFGVVSAMSFKKPYYVGPALPGLVLLLGAAAERFYSSPLRRPRLARAVWIVLVLAGAGLVAGGYVALSREIPRAAGGMAAVACAALVLMATAGLMLRRGRPWPAFGLTAVSSVAVFLSAWFFCGATLDNTAKVATLARVLDEADIPETALVAWASRRPDARLSFYYNRRTRQMIQPAEIVTAFVDRTGRRLSLESMVARRARELLAGPQPVYIILDREEYERAAMLGMTATARVVGFAPDPDDADSDWMVITREPAASAPAASSPASGRGPGRPT